MQVPPPLDLSFVGKIVDDAPAEAKFALVPHPPAGRRGSAARLERVSRVARSAGRAYPDAMKLVPYRHARASRVGLVDAERGRVFPLG